MEYYCPKHKEVYFPDESTPDIGEYCPSCAAESPTRVLILSCSYAKVHTPERMPAIDRYNGPAFQVYRKFQSEHPERAAEISTYILSAKFGLITANTPIPDYDYKMTPTRAKAIKPQIAAYLRDSVFATADDIMLCMSPIYRTALSIPVPALRDGVKIHLTPGGIGEKIAKLRRWLYEEN